MRLLLFSSHHHNPQSISRFCTCQWFIPFLLLSGILWYGHTTACLGTEGHLSCFQFSALWLNLVCTCMDRCLCGCKCSLLWDQKCPGCDCWVLCSYTFSFIRNCFPEKLLSFHAHQQCMNNPISLRYVCLRFYLICFLFVFSFSYSFISLFSPFCELLEHFIRFHFDLFVVFVSVSLCLVFSVVALAITVFVWISFLFLLL